MRVRDTLRVEAPAVRLDAAFAGDEGEVNRYGELLADPLTSQEFERVLTTTTWPSIRALLATLTEREQQVLRWRYGLDGGPELSLRQVARRLGVSAERVRQIEERALVKLRTNALAKAPAQT
jgi:RNA polymerase sigma factor (sigma-70 family)